MHLTERDIRQWTGDATFARSNRYVSSAIRDPRRVQNGAMLMLKALCQGSEVQPYHVQVTLQQNRVTHGQCSCPVGSGSCKHVAALLRTWLAEPDRFRETEPIDTLLERRNKAELIALIKLMLGRDPDLEPLLELPLPVAGGSALPLDPQLLRRQLEALFAGADHEWADARRIARDVQALVELGQSYGVQADWHNAATVFTTILEAALRHPYALDDENGNLYEIIEQCVGGLGECLDATSDPAARQPILRALFDLYRWDTERGGSGMADDAVELLLHHATSAERHLLAQWIRAALPGGAGISDGYHRQSYGALLLQLAADQIDDDTFLRICRETGRIQDAVERLMQLQRMDEAEQEARLADDYTLLQLVDRFVAQSHAQRAERLIEQRMETSQDTRFVEWLKDRAQGRGDHATALKLTERLFWQRPSLDGYREIKRLAQATGRWTDARPKLLARLAKQSQARLITEIHLNDGEVAQALKMLPEAQQSWALGSWLPPFGAEPLGIRVARAAEASYPDDAITLYLAAITKLINERGRENYATAAQYLQRVHTIYRYLGDDQAWNALIEKLREQHRSLRALKEELDKIEL